MEELLIRLGAKEWEKGGLSRLYFSDEQVSEITNTEFKYTIYIDLNSKTDRLHILDIDSNEVVGGSKDEIVRSIGAYIKSNI